MPREPSELSDSDVRLGSHCRVRRSSIPEFRTDTILGRDNPWEGLVFGRTAEQPFEPKRVKGLGQAEATLERDEGGATLPGRP